MEDREMKLYKGTCKVCNEESETENCRYEYSFLCSKCFKKRMYEDGFYTGKGLKWIDPEKELPNKTQLVLIIHKYAHSIVEVDVVFFRISKNKNTTLKYPFGKKNYILGWHPIPEYISSYY